MISLRKLLKENEDNLRKVDAMVSQLWKKRPPTYMENFLDLVFKICDEYGVDYDRYLIYLANKRNERK